MSLTLQNHGRLDEHVVNVDNIKDLVKELAAADRGFFASQMIIS